MRLQKKLADLGLGSRRQIEGWIIEGRITINGKLAVLGCQVDDADIIKVDGKIIKQQIKTTPKARLIMYNKPEGEICTRSDPKGRRTVFTSLPDLYKQRWIAIGRLDLNSSGLLLFTTDGQLANKFMHPRSNIEREYVVRVLGEVTDKIKEKMLKGVLLDDGTKVKLKSIEYVGGKGANSWYSVIITEGKYREIRRIFDSQGLKVSRLKRVRFGKIKLPKSLAAGRYQELDIDRYTNI